LLGQRFHLGFFVISHGNPLGCELKGCGDLDSTAGRDSHPDSEVPA
jgi:hypothetical protein